jgi:putative hemolysin
MAIAAAAIAALPLAAWAMRNPAAVYCEALGYKYVIEKTTEGDAGRCVLPGGKAVDAWAFLQGKEGEQHGGCAKKGLKQKVVKDRKHCQKFFVDECTVCVQADGREVEVTELMQLDFAETSCGDGRCGFPENSKSCPADCPTGSPDLYCDGARDGRCDPDCKPQQDPDCPRQQ